MRPALRALGLCLALLAPMAAKAQDLATLIADKVAVSGDNSLIASGGVEVLYQGRRLRASRIIYDKTTDKLQIEGPITLSDGSDTLVLASAADLSADLTNGVLTSARLVLNQQLQVAAARIFRVDGRYTQLANTVASSCQVCASNPTPLWEIRAKRVVHDQLEHQLYFDQATLRFSGIPIGYIPRLRMPDPTLTRATGVLPPSLRTTSGLGYGLKLPYFITLGQNRDLTLTPYISTKGGRTLAARYRQAFRTGTVQLDGALSFDRLLPGKRRGYILATGAFTLPRDFKLKFQLETVSDAAYLLDYGLEPKDRLDSRVELTRARRNEYISARQIQFQSIRAGESISTLPSVVTDLTFHRRFSGGPLGGEAGLRFQTHSHYRSSSSPLDADLDGHADGRDLGRLSLRLDWRRNWVLPAGIIGSVLTEGTADIYDIRQDAIYQGKTTRLDGAAAVELRWPWVGAGKNGASHVIEPVAQLVISPKTTPALPNEDSALVEFDEGNLFALNRFAGSDAYERGARANLGLNWTRHDPNGWSMGTTIGRVLRADDLGQFGPASGLDGSHSDWLLANQITLSDGSQLTNRLLFNDGFDLTKAELRLDLDRRDYGLSTSFVRMIADPSENRPIATSELFLDGRYALTDNWTGKVSNRYDFVANRATDAGLGVEFRNECLSLDLSLSRRFTSSTSVKPTTEFGLSVDLLGFGSGAASGPARVCRR